MSIKMQVEIKELKERVESLEKQIQDIRDSISKPKRQAPKKVAIG